MTSAFLHDMSMAVHKEDSSRKTRERQTKKKKKYKHQALSKSIFFIQPNSKYFNHKESDLGAHRKCPGRPGSSLTKEPKRIVTVDQGFVRFDFLNVVDKAFNSFLLEPLTSANLMIGDAEKKVA